MRFLSSLLLYAALANVVHTLPVPREAANHATQNSTHIFFLLDRSGSMETIRDDVIGGYNSYVKTQQTQTGAGDLYMSLIQFDGQEPHEKIFTSKPIAETPMLDRTGFQPRGSTPLFDAIGHVMLHAQKEVEKSAASADRQNVIIVVFSDGEENSSREFTRDKIFEVIERRRAEGWTIVFLGANQDSYAQGGSMGFAAGNTQNFAFDHDGVKTAFDSVSRATSTYRALRKSGGMRRMEEAMPADKFFGDDKEAERDYQQRVKDSRGL